MPKAAAVSETDYTVMPTQFTVEFEQIKNFNKSTGEWELVPLYSTPAYIKYHEKMPVLDGKAITDDVDIAMELVDTPKVTVTPDPRPYVQERDARALQDDVLGAPWRGWELYRFVTNANEWRAKHNLPELTVKVERVARPSSALVQGIPVPAQG